MTKGLERGVVARKSITDPGIWRRERKAMAMRRVRVKDVVRIRVTR